MGRVDLTDISHIRDYTSALYIYLQFHQRFGAMSEFKDYREPFIKRDKETDKITQQWYESREAQAWGEVQIHCIPQMWPNTSGGWQMGMAGQAFMTDTTIFIENLKHGLVFVFYDGQLAYIAELSKDQPDYRNYPSYSAAGTERYPTVKVVYKQPQNR